MSMNFIFPSVYNEYQTVNILFIFKASPCYFILASVCLVGFGLFVFAFIAICPHPDTLPGRMVLGSGCVWV